MSHEIVTITSSTTTGTPAAIFIIKNWCRHHKFVHYVICNGMLLIFHNIYVPNK